MKSRVARFLGQINLLGQRHPVWTAAAGFALILLVMFSRQIFLGRTLMPVDLLYNISPWSSLLPGYVPQNTIGSDAVRQGYPLLTFAIDAVKHGYLPIWNPYILAGAPSFAILPLFYPPALLYLLGPIAMTYTYMVIVHIFLAGLFTFIFLRNLQLHWAAAFAAGLIFMFSQVVYHWSESTANVASMAWLPLLLFLIDRLVSTRRWGYVAPLAVAFAMPVLATEFQFAYYAIVTACLYFVWRLVLAHMATRDRRGLLRRLAIFSAGAVLGAALSAVHLWPALELRQDIMRSGWSVDYIAQGVLSLRQVITFIVPNFFGNTAEHVGWNLNLEWFMDHGYVGILPLFLALAALLRLKYRDRWFFAALAGFSGLLMFSPAANRMLYSAVTLFGNFRSTPRLAYLYAFSLACLAGIGFDYLLANEIPAKILRRLGIWTVSLAALMVATATAFTLLYAYWSWAVLPKRYLAVQVAALAVLMAASIAILYFVRNGRLAGRGLAIAVITMLLVDVFFFNYSYHPAIDSKLAFPPTPSSRYLAQDKTLFRIYRYEGSGRSVTAVTPTYTPDTPIVYGLQDAQGSTVYIPRRYVEFLNLIEDHRSDAMFNEIRSLGYPASLDSKLLDLLNVKYMLSTVEIRDSSWKPVFSKEINIYRNNDVLPRAFVVHRARTFTTDKKMATYMKGTAFNPGSEALLEKSAGPLPGSVDRDDARVLAYEPTLVSVQTRTTKRGLLVVTDNYDPGWEATVDGQPAEILRADYTFRAVAVPAGRHTVIFRFKPASQRFGIYVSLAALATLLLLSATSVLISCRRGRTA